MVKISKRLKEIYSNVDKEKQYSLEDAVKVVKTNAKAKFDETIDIAVSLNIDVKKGDQNIRGMISLPHGTGKTYKVAAFVKEDKVKEAKDAGADSAGSDELIEQVKKGEINFDRCVATPDMMASLGKIAKILGPKGLMPNPKLGTVTDNIKDAVKALKAGQVEYRAEKSGIVHAGIAKASFDVGKIKENIKTLIDALNKAKPDSVKGAYLKSISLSSTQGAGVKVDISSL